MCTTWIPAASSRAAAAITSITMKGGTSLRADGAMRSSADFSICSNCLNLLDEQIAVRQAPYGCRICRLGLSRVRAPAGGRAEQALANSRSRTAHLIHPWSALGPHLGRARPYHRIPDSAVPAAFEDTL